VHLFVPIRPAVIDFVCQHNGRDMALSSRAQNSLNQSFDESKALVVIQKGALFVSERGEETCLFGNMIGCVS
jgi:hypothetical protein